MNFPVKAALPCKADWRVDWFVVSAQSKAWLIQGKVKTKPWNIQLTDAWLDENIIFSKVLCSWNPLHPKAQTPLVKYEPSGTAG